MDASFKQVKMAAILIGGLFDSPTELKIQLFGLFETVKDLTYQIFTNNYNTYLEKDKDRQAAVDLLREYCVEMKESGEVKFDGHT